MLWLATVGSLPPIARPTMLMGDSNQVNVILSHAIDDAVGKTRNDPLAESPSERGTCFGVGGNPFRRLFHGCQEPETEPIKMDFIELDRFSHLRPCLRVEDRFLHERFARSSAKT